MVESTPLSTALVERLRSMPTAEVRAVYARWASVENRARARRLLALAVLDERHVVETQRDMGTEEWVAGESRVTARRAHAEVRVARTLTGHPAVADAAAAGDLSWDQLDPLTKLVRPETDARWAREAPTWEPDRLAALARRRSAVTPAAAAARRDRRTLRWWIDAEEGMVNGRFALPDADGATFVKAIEREMSRTGKGGAAGWEPHECRAADALVALASQRVADDADPERACVTITVPDAALHAARGDVPGSELDELEIALAVDTVRRLTCDARCKLLIERADGAPIGLGRTARTVPPWLYRFLKHRDRHCRGPGCERTRGLQAHHIVHWGDGGPTDPDNLMLLCPRCHVLLHEGRWSARGDPVRSDGLDRALEVDGRSPLDDGELSLAV